MKNVRFLTLALAALLISGHAAFAFSVEQRETTNNDGTQKFADPDEQMPAGLTAPDSGSMNNAAGMTEPSVNALTAPQMMGMDQGNQAFDHAYNHLQNQNR